MALHRKIPISVYDTLPRMEKCSWRQSGLFVNANLDVLPCCYRPCVKPIGNLRTTPLKELAKGQPHDAYREECLRCPTFIGS